MRIIEIDITNTKKLKAFRKVLGGDNLEVAGSTATGKTTAVSALWEILEKGGDALTHGEKRGCIRVTLGDGDRSIIAERVHTKAGSTISLTAHNGKTPEKISPADFKKMLSRLSVNPHKIMDMGPTERVRTLMAAADIEIDLEALDEEIRKKEESRLEAFRKMEAIEPGDAPEKTDAVSTMELLAEKARIEAHNRSTEAMFRKHEALIEQVSRADEWIKAKEERIESLREEILELQDRIGAMFNDRQINDAKATEAMREANSAGTLGLSKIDAELADVDRVNEKAALWKRWSFEKARWQDAKDEHLEIFRQVNELRDQKKTALESAKWPLGGLTIEDGQVMYKGFLLENLGESEQMLVCAALAIADIQKHPVRVVRMDGVESMSKADFDALKGLFNGRGIQVLSTRVSRGDAEPSEIVIVDGEYSEEGGDK
jgi:hypothetical protein